MATTYFHYAPIRLREGSIIEPGNWGRMLRATRQAFVNTNGQPPFLVDGILARELLFEAMRLKEFAALPSRLGSCFVCPTSEDAQTYQNATDPQKLQILHTVEIVDPGAASHLTWVSHTGITANVPFLPLMEEKARAYWRGDAGDPNYTAREIITSSAIRIVSTSS